MTAVEILSRAPFVELQRKFCECDPLGRNSEGCKYTAELAYNFSMAYSITGDKDSNIIPLMEGICTAALSVVSLYPKILGENFICTILKDDLIGSSSASLKLWQQDCPETRTVEEFLIREIDIHGLEELRSNRSSAVVKFLWMIRALNFIFKFLENTVTGNSDNLFSAATNAYTTALKPYHGFMKAGIVNLALQLCPSRIKFMGALGFQDMDVALDICRRLIQVSKPCIEQVNCLLIKYNCNFPDKV
ncbi:hypothetical protein cand_013400 [Cryptosporidium andersoni]|uniref:Glycolipid transfer protein domain-containing protein n=1 Tax=Cryptosporidium andersoni TaxID=117008 RepID=A0A1J4MUG0_9CRYT|nr:hypothetical protein cand_013400 [Cryptosporidium andersoni]